MKNKILEIANRVIKSEYDIDDLCEYVKFNINMNMLN